VATLEVDNTTKGELARLMVGRELQAPLARTGAAPGPVLLRLDGVEARDDRGSLGLKGIDLEVRAGEILGIAGVAGNGQQYLAEVVAGLRPMSAGRVEVRGRNRTGATPREMIAAGVVHVPSDRLGMGLAPNMSLAENLAIRSYRKPPLARGPFLDRRRMAAAAVELIERFNVSTPGPATPARNLSGGNQQKAILAREITAGHATAEGAVIVAADPTRGLDVGAVEAVRSHLAAASRRGSAVLLISEDLDDLLVMADRIAVFHRGEVMGVVTPSETSVEELGLLMAGERRS
jgi:simple sugar transport system ATP-binding protein